MKDDDMKFQYYFFQNFFFRILSKISKLKITFDCNTFDACNLDICFLVIGLFYPRKIGRRICCVRKI